MRSVKREQARWLAGGAIAGGVIAIGLVAAFGGFGSSGGEAPVLAVGVAPVKGGEVIATVNDPPPNLKDGQSFRPAVVGTAPIDDAGHFVLRVDPKLPAIARELARNGGFVNIELEERGADGKNAITDFPRTLAHGRWTDANGLRVNPKYEIVMG